MSARALPAAVDIVIVGAGHNGLACAAYLSRAGRQVLRFTTVMTDLWRTAAPYLQGHPTRIRPAALARSAKSRSRSTD